MLRCHVGGYPNPLHLSNTLFIESSDKPFSSFYSSGFSVSIWPLILPFMGTIVIEAISCLCN